MFSSLPLYLVSIGCVLLAGFCLVIQCPYRLLTARRELLNAGYKKLSVSLLPIPLHKPAQDLDWFGDGLLAGVGNESIGFVRSTVASMAVDIDAQS